MLKLISVFFALMPLLAIANADPQSAARALPFVVESVMISNLFSNDHQLIKVK